MNKDEKIVEQRNWGLMLENLARLRKLMFRIFKKQDSYSQSFIPHFTAFSVLLQFLMGQFLTFKNDL